jgi:hypothetical protein
LKEIESREEKYKVKHPLKKEEHNNMSRMYILNSHKRKRFSCF